MAQLVEQRIRNAWVTGSSPVFGSTFHSPPLLGKIKEIKKVKEQRQYPSLLFFCVISEKKS